MELDALKKRFYSIVSPSLPNDWEVEDVLCHLQELSSDKIESLFSQVIVIWPVSHSLCFAYLTDGARHVDVIPETLISEWSRRILNLYETGGLIAARKFMAEPQTLFLGPLDGLCGVSFLQISERMQMYLDGISGRHIELSVAPLPQTDTSRICVPDSIDIFLTQAENKMFYKFLISLQWAHVQSRIFEDYLLLLENSSDSVFSFFASFANDQKAKELFGVLQFAKSMGQLERNLPGLFRGVQPLCVDLITKISSQSGSVVYCNFLKSVLQNVVRSGDSGGGVPFPLDDAVRVSLDRLQSENTFQVLPDFYICAAEHKGDYDLGDFKFILGSFDFDSAASVIHKRREEEKSTFVALLAKALEGREEGEDPGMVHSTMSEADGNALLLLDGDSVDQQEIHHDEFLIENTLAELSEELKAVIATIEEDLGELPEAYVQAAAGMAGKGVNSREPLELESNRLKVTPGIVGYSYDEWDYRRGGYRDSWCTLYEKTVARVRSTFVRDTLKKYKGQLHKIRRQFEMLRNQSRFVRRRRYGDDIDFDALVDALGDTQAGIVPSDRLFLRLLRDRREVSTCFLVDMSNSTEGWVGVAVKESLVLMAEAMDIVGDPYAIYGFSGMRRSKSEVYTIKELREPYSNVVKERIAGIGPKEYTRMGPPIRHMTKKMLGSDSRVRLLIVFSDGKPEDYDDYKGKYAIEDTRKALLEARGAGVHVFCVTIDKTAHEYLGHMFGRGQFVFVDNVEALPGKLVDLYRLLTQ